MSEGIDEEVSENYAGHRRAALDAWRAHSRSAVIARLLLIASAGVYIALRVRSIWTQRLWGDEVFNYSVSQGTWTSIFERAGLDMAHPPLFYLLLKVWIYVVGSSVVGLRVLTVAIAIAALVPLLILCRELRFRSWETVLALSLIAVNNYLVIYSFYLRQYSLLLFFALCSHAAFVKLLRRNEPDERRLLFFYIAINVLFVYTHYFGWLAIISQYLWVAFAERQQWRRFTWALAITLLGFLPWVGLIVYVSTQVSYTFWDQISWDRPPNWHSLVMLFQCFNGGFRNLWVNLAGIGVFLIILIASFKDSLRRPRLTNRDDDADDSSDFKTLAMLAWLAAFPVVVSLVFCYAFTSIWAPRYLIASVVPYILLISACAFRLRALRARAAAVAFLIVWSMVSGFTYDLGEALHGSNAQSYSLARDLARTETRTGGHIRIYGLSPYAEHGLRLGLNMAGERRFDTIPYQANMTLSDDYFWIAVIEHDPFAMERARELAADPSYAVGEPLYSGVPPHRHILFSVRRR